MALLLIIWLLPSRLFDLFLGAAQCTRHQSGSAELCLVRRASTCVCLDTRRGFGC